jgi:outer membrane protein W
VFIDDVEAEGLVPRTEFSNTTGLVLDAGLRVPLSKRWSLTGDARYVAVETSGTVRFGNSATEGGMDVRPLIVGFGAAYRF